MPWVGWSGFPLRFLWGASQCEVGGFDLEMLAVNFDAFNHGVQVLLTGFLMQGHMEQLANFGAWLAHPLCDFWIVGEQQKASIHAFNLVDGQEHFLGGISHQVHDGPPALLVPCCSQEILGLVEDEEVLGFRLDALAFHDDFVGSHHFGAQSGDDFAVDSDRAGGYEQVRFSTGAHAGICDELV